jgi:hypothetical protein
MPAVKDHFTKRNNAGSGPFKPSTISVLLRTDRLRMLRR